MIESTCAPSYAFSLISWVFIIQSGHIIYQTKAEYLSYDGYILKIDYSNLLWLLLA